MIKKNISFFIFILIILFSCNNKYKKITQILPNDSILHTQWYNQSKFGIFLHLSSSVNSECSNTTKRYRDSITRHFHPRKLKLDNIVDEVVNSGAKYLYFTAKDVNDFCFFRSKSSSFNTYKSPYKLNILDVLRGLVKEKKFRWGIYYPFNQTSLTDSNLSFTTHQIVEILSNFGEIQLLWLDKIPKKWMNSAELNNLISCAKDLQPKMLIHSPLNFSLMEKENNIFIKSVDIEAFLEETNTHFSKLRELNVNLTSVSTINSDENLKSSKEIIQKMVETVAQNNNFCLNIWINFDGSLSDATINRLKEIGEWMKINGESIYSTQKNDVLPKTQELITQKRIKDTINTYVHLFNWPKDMKFTISPFVSKLKSASLLGTNQLLSFQNDTNTHTLTVILPEIPVNSVDNVILLKIIQ